MLNACGGSAARPPRADVPAPSPVVETREVVVRQCPAALASPVQRQPEPRADAVVEYNDAGARHLAELIAWGAAGWAALTDAKADCPEVEPD